MDDVCCFFFKQKTAYEMRISDWSSDVCSSDLHLLVQPVAAAGAAQFLQHLGEYLDQIGDVADRIVDLPLVERAARPVGEARALVELHAQPGRSEERRVGKGCVRKCRSRWSAYN